MVGDDRNDLWNKWNRKSIHSFSISHLFPIHLFPTQLIQPPCPLPRHPLLLNLPFLAFSSTFLFFFPLFSQFHLSLLNLSFGLETVKESGRKIRTAVRRKQHKPDRP